MKKVIGFSLIALTVACIGVFLYVNTWAHKATPQTVNNLEKALATDDLLLLGHIDVKKIATLKNILEGKSAEGQSDPQPLPIPGLAESSLKEFSHENTNSNLEHILFSLNEKKEDKPVVQLILLGQFDWGKIKPVLSNGYNISSEAADIIKLTVKPIISDEVICPEDIKQDKKIYDTYYLYNSPTKLVISSDRKKIDILIDRVNNQANTNINLANWKKYRSGKLVSFAAFNPLSASNFSNGITKMVLQKSLTDVDTLFASAAVNLFKRGIELDSQFDANSTWIDKISKGVDEQLTTFNIQADSISPSASKLISSIKTNKSDHQYNVSLVINSNSLKNIRNTIGEVFASMFNFGPSNDSETSNEEQIDKNPWDFTKNKFFANLEPYKPDNFWSAPQLISGPFAVGLTKIAIGEKSDLVELTIDANMQLPEDVHFSYNSEAELELNIKSVTDINNQEHLRNEICYKPKPGENFFKKNNEPAKGFNNSNNKVQIKKTIRLIPNTDIGNLNSVKGSLKFTAPSIIKTRSLKPKVGSSIEEEGLRIFISKINKQSISYEVSGNKNKLIDVRALNSKGEVIRGNHSSFMKSETKDRATDYFHGNIHSVKFLIAEKFEKKNLDFDLKFNDFFNSTVEPKNSMAPNIDPSIVQKNTWQRFSTVNLENIDLSKSRGYYSNENPTISRHSDSPLMLQVSHNYNSWSNQPKFEILIPFIPELARNLSAIELQVHQMNENAISTNEFIEITPDITNGIYQASIDIENKPLFLLKITLDIGVEKQQKINKLDGKVIIRLPKSIKKNILPNPKFTERKSINENAFSLIEIDKGFIPKLAYEYSGNPKELINVIAITKQGDKIFPEQTSYKNGKWSIQYDFRNDIDHFELLLADKQTLVEYPFNIIPSYPTEAP